MHGMEPIRNARAKNQKKTLHIGDCMRLENLSNDDDGDDPR